MINKKSALHVRIHIIHICACKVGVEGSLLYIIVHIVLFLLIDDHSNVAGHSKL